MEPHQIVVSDVIEPEVEHLLSAGLSAFNDQATGISDWQALAVTVHDPETQQVLGGITGRTSLGLLFLDLFYLPESLRGSGWALDCSKPTKTKAAGVGVAPRCSTP